MKQLSREWIERYANDPEMYVSDDVRVMAQMLLAWMDQEPVADVVAWSSPNDERTCDIRWRRHDVAPGQLYTSPPVPVMPDGCVMVPIEPTEDMVIEGFESAPDRFFSKPWEWEAYEAMSGCQQAAHRAKLCWAAMLAAAPKAP